MESPVGKVVIVGTGFVADLYMRSLKTFPDVAVAGAFDIDAARLKAFCDYWSIPAAESLGALIAEDALVLNLTNPHAHYDVSKAALEAGRDVYSEKPLATKMTDAHALAKLANDKGLMLASAPCNWLSQSAQTVWAAVSSGQAGTPRLVYAELDDDFIPQAPYDKWRSESGAPWPAKDEFEVGCTLEHAGYYLTWLMAMFGPVETLVAASANLIPDKLPDGAATAPDFSTATLFFKNGVVARLSCSIIAPHDHRIRIIGDAGVIELDECWSNTAPVYIRKRHVVRRKLLNSPLAKRFGIGGKTHPKVGRWGAAAMNFALGPAELLAARAAQRKPQITADFALHLNEVTLAIQESGKERGAQKMTTTFAPLAPVDWAAKAGARMAGEGL
ncbi:Gfo/Idh/MocA family protein [Hyphococcus sp.]|uniref:Gfo/Idh/MocA family protein n=1 Tax=Hyphococcus sp. TaxID=2038636 RepID=UPI00208A7112|nr:MAG: dehydrogenase [Marinicaulis sp.]